MNFVKTSGGKEEAGYGTEDKDCSVRAWAIAKNIPYAQAHAEFKAAGRPDSGGTSVSTSIAVMGAPTKSFLRHERPTVRKLMLIAQDKTVIVHIEKHAFCVKKGSQMDLWVNNAGKSVHRYWIIK